MYYFQEKDHQLELNKIKFIEDMNNKKMRDLEILRAKTTPCPLQNLDNPRECYFKSDYKCSWNTDTERCERRD